MMQWFCPNCGGEHAEKRDQGTLCAVCEVRAEIDRQPGQPALNLPPEPRLARRALPGAAWPLARITSAAHLQHMCPACVVSSSLDAMCDRCHMIARAVQELVMQEADLEHWKSQCLHRKEQRDEARHLAEHYRDEVLRALKCERVEAQLLPWEDQ